MKKINRSEQKVRLMAQAEKLIGELLEWEEGPQCPKSGKEMRYKGGAGIR